MKNKSTHSGSCQACGRVQKLPNDRLSKHGYTVQWGFFEGTCPGSKHLPFEVSCDLIKKFIADAERQRAEVQEDQRVLRQPVAEDCKTAWFHDYKHPSYGRGNRGGYVWRKVEIIAEPHSYEIRPGEMRHFNTFSCTDINGKRRKIDIYGTGVNTLAEACTYLNGLRAESLNKLVDQLTNYIDWQTNRVKNWKPGKLTPVEG